MSEIPTNHSEKKEALDDNARKFTLESFDIKTLENLNATSFVLTTDWLKTDAYSEEKLAYKEFDNGDIQILLIAKVTQDGKRTSVKEKITEAQYRDLKANSILSVQKTRYEFTYLQTSTSFSMKYDEFANSNLRILEVDAENDTERELFSPNDFPTPLTEVTGNMDFYGYRVAGVV